MNDSLFAVSDQVIAVTGGTGVLGSVMAIALAERGAKVAIIGRNADKGNAVIERAGEVPGEIAFFKADMTDQGACESAADAIMTKFSKIDALVNGAGGNVPEATTGEEVSPEPDAPEEPQASAVQPGSAEVETVKKAILDELDETKAMEAQKAKAASAIFGGGSFSPQ